MSEMTLPECETLLLDLTAGTLHITLNRPERRNAMNGTMVDELIAVFEAIADDRSVRAVVLRGTEGNFCAGGDISGMNMDAGDKTDGFKRLKELNRSFGTMIAVVDNAPQVVIALLEGAVLGGGFGLACVSDVAIADQTARMGMPETGLGIPPAQIAPFVVSRIGLTQTRRLTLLGDWVKGQEALDLGIVHYMTDTTEAMEAELASVLKRVRRAAPGANAVSKALIHQVATEDRETILDCASEYFAEALVSEEGKEGTKAFLEKRLPSWAGE